MKKVYFIGLTMGVLFLSACTGNNISPQEIGILESVPAEYAGRTNPLGVDAATDGAKVFQTNCESCHGSQGHGDGPAGVVLDPQPKNLPELALTASDAYFFWRINTGKPGTSMAPWAGILTDEQIWQVIAYIRTLK